MYVCVYIWNIVLLKVLVLYMFVVLMFVLYKLILDDWRNFICLIEIVLKGLRK